MLTWEAVTAISTALTAIVIAATVAVGYRQIRLANDQLEHFRRSTQLDGTMKVFAELGTPEMRAARLFVEKQLAQRMLDANFREGLTRPEALDEKEHQELIVTQMLEKMGTYARHGLLDTVLIADFCGPLIRDMWQSLEKCGYFEARRRKNPYSLENFEYLYDEAMSWYENDDPPFRTTRRESEPAALPEPHG